MDMKGSVETKHFRLAHISDLHFSQLSWNPTQFLSKRWIGNANLLLRRMREIQHDKVYRLLDHFKKEEVNYVLISGDLSTTSLPCEFAKASEFLTKLKSMGVEVITLPGNHDHYTKKDYVNKTFYQYFDASFGREGCSFAHYNLKDHKLAVKKLDLDWWMIALDTAIATPLLSCHGNFTSEIASNLRKVLNELPEDSKVLLANHFPLFTSDHLHKHLIGDAALRDLLHEFPKVKFYLHGHTHRHCIADLRNAGLPILLDSGCTAHEEKGTWNLLDFSENTCSVKPYRWSSIDKGAWDWNEKNPTSFEFS